METSPAPWVTVFVPAYNEVQNLARCVQVILAKMDELNLPVEILVVDDASQDGTDLLAERIASREARVRLIRHAENLGIGGAFKTAIRHARGVWLILIPADLALDPDALRCYFESLDEVDAVVGLRSDFSDYNLLRKAVHFANIALIRSLFGVRLSQFQYITLYRLEMLRALEIEYWRSAFFLAEVLIKAHTLGYRLKEVEIRYAPRTQGKATGAKLKLLLLTVRDIFSFWLRWHRVGARAACQRSARQPL